MHTTKIDLPLKKREKVVQLLNDRLADLADLRIQAKQAHWNVKGPTFIALHELFDSVAEEVIGYVDDVAERITTLGGVADGTLGGIAKRTSLKPYPTNISEGPAHVDALSDALAAAGKLIRAAIDQADELEDAGTADLFTGISRGLDKKLWFVEAHLQAKK
jgi:starvation-inducible DNA-binding protein